MEQSLLNKQEKQQSQPRKKKQVFCCCFGGGDDVETDEEQHHQEKQQSQPRKKKQVFCCCFGGGDDVETDEEQHHQEKQQSQPRKKKQVFCCCFGGGDDVETDEEQHHHQGQQEPNYFQQNSQDVNNTTTIPCMSNISQPNSEIYTSQGYAQQSKAKNSPQKERKRDMQSSSHNSRVIKEQGEENNSSSSSNSTNNQQQNYQKSQNQNINEYNTPNPQQNAMSKNTLKIQSHKKSTEQSYTNEHDTYLNFDQSSQALNADLNHSLQSKNNLKNSVKKAKYNIKAFLQQYKQQQTDLFHLYCKKKESYLLVKTLEKNFQSNSFLNSQVNQNPSKQSICQKGVVSTDPNSYFYNRNFKSDFDSQFNAIPEPICQYLSSRLKNQIVVDAFCGVGYNTVQFAKEASQVIAIDCNQVKVSHAKYNIESFKQQHKVEVIQSDFLQMKKLKADTVVLHPDYKKFDNSISSSQGIDNSINLLTEVQPNLVEALKLSFKISDSVVIILQKSCDIQQLPQVLEQANYPYKKFAVEIELMHIDRKFNLALVFLGDIAQVSKEEVVEYYTKLLYESSDVQNQIFMNKIKSILVHIMHTSKIKGVSQLIENCEKSVASQQNRKTLFQEFYDCLSEKKGRIRSSGNLQFEADSIVTTDKSLKQLIRDIDDILSANQKSNFKSQSPSSNEDLGSYNYKFDFEGSNKFNGKPKKKAQFNQSMQETAHDNSSSQSLIKSALTKKQVKGLNKNTVQQLKKSEQNNSIMSKGFKNSDLSNNNQNAGNNQNNQSEDNLSENHNEYEYHTSQYNDEDYGDSIPKIIYSCSYETNQLIDSEGSENNSLRPQFSNGIYFNQSTDVYDEQEFRASIMNLKGGSNYYDRPLVKHTNSAGGILGFTREQFLNASIQTNGSGKGQTILIGTKSQKNNESKNNLSGYDDNMSNNRSASKLNQYYQQDFQEDCAEFDWQQEEGTENSFQQQPKQTQTKIKNNINTFQNNPDLDESYKNTKIQTVPNSLS
ncbi:RNA cap guanine-N2 methyltransferase (macronuclear) [Tetrahymena thermophila SB210]|uniref:Trimethylguanosine synthase n=1 Tax=Tetrahymena thermophila (strain SB210) TaxID=312017 RepID=Q22MG6_TETTS|nr:RNA cap guanine-N2 methyltransferase [Tetrahymena thermophila SB210]EAR86341.2 RNA cap guanine-N2 methyltransferase [Tetrahymena thermophila SB210]|eukprot:XP_977054.2 RNA cap guanine-N2 methyltransferase [Tetrahymena thermophila SB210]